MGAEAERQVVVRVSVDSEIVRIAEHRLIEVRRFEKQDDFFALLELRAVKLEVGRHGAGHVLHR